MTKRNWILFFIASIFLFVDFSNFKNEISFKVQANKRQKIQLFYDSYLHKGNFSEKFSERKDLSLIHQFEEINFHTPNIALIKKIRIDLGNIDNEFILKELKFKSLFLDYELELDQIVNFSTFNNHISAYEMDQSSLKISTEGNDPYFIINNTFIWIKTINYLLLSVLSIIIAFSIIVLLKWLDRLIFNRQLNLRAESINKKLEIKIIDHRLFWFILMALFFIVAFYGSLNHEMWRDELEMYSKYKGGNFSFLDIIVKPYSFIYHKLSSSIAYVKLFHVLISTGTVFLIVRYSPFSQMQKILFVFSYFILYEYTIISRTYGFTIFLFLSIVVLLLKKNIRYLPILILLFILTKHNLYGAVFSFVIVIYLVLKFHEKRIWTVMLSRVGKTKIVIISVLIMIGAGVLLINYREFYLERITQVKHLFSSSFFNTTRTIWTAFFPVPDLTNLYVWDTNILPFLHNFNGIEDVSKSFNIFNILALYLSISIFYFIYKAGFEKPGNKAPFILGLVLLLFVYQFVGLYFIRYIGLIFILFISVYWLLDKRNELFKLFVSCVLFVQFIVGIYFYIQDIKKPFTASYQAADYLKTSELLEDHLIVGRNDYHAQPISILLDTEIYYPQIEKFGTHVNWSNPERNKWISDKELIRKSQILSDQYNKNLIVIVENKIDQSLVQDNGFTFLKGFETTMVESEKYYIYQYEIH